MARINTSEDWWQELNDNWDNIFLIMEQFLDLSKSAPLKEVTKNCITLRQYVIKLKKERNHSKLNEFLFEAWNQAPDASSIHSIPSWDDLCDLLSEAWVFNEEEVKEHSDYENEASAF